MSSPALSQLRRSGPGNLLPARHDSIEDRHESVDHRQRSGRFAALAIGAGRLAVGAAFLAKPVQSVRFLGVDTATATRLDWLARMTAARDAALGVGTIVSTVRGRGSATWLLAGAACDAVDAAAIGVALSQRRLAVVPATATVGAAGAAVALAGSILWRRRSPRQTSRAS